MNLQRKAVQRGDLFFGGLLRAPGTGAGDNASAHRHWRNGAINLAQIVSANANRHTRIIPGDRLKVTEVYRTRWFGLLLPLSCSGNSDGIPTRSFRSPEGRLR